MCGIVGVTGKGNCTEALLAGLRRLEYRGYDSAGLALAGHGKLEVLKRPGKVGVLAEETARRGTNGTCGIGHTRWATHGGATEANAHPHACCKSEIAVVHNGIIENYAALRQVLEGEGHKFQSETDTEVISHLIERFYADGGPLEDAVAEALRELSGAYGIAVVSSREPDKIVAARRGSPLVLARGNDGATLLASDAQALLDPQGGVIFLKDGEIAILTPGNLRVLDSAQVEVEPEVQELAIEVLAAEKGDFPHFMLKEIYEQPSAVENTLRGRLDLKEGIPRLGGLQDVQDQLRRMKRVVVTACGTSWHAGLVAKYLFEELGGIQTEVDYASELRYRNPILDDRTLVIVISQSGETADTLAALREARTKGAMVIGVCNVPGSSIARETEAGVFTKAGPEIGVASTKAFTCQITVLTLIATMLGRQRRLSLAAGAETLQALASAPELIKRTLECDSVVRKIAAEVQGAKNFLYVGRGINFPVALEGALKLKEISYIHAEGYPAAEMKHGPIALIDESMPVVVVAPRDHTHEKIGSNIQEIRARNGKVIVLCTEGDDETASRAHAAIELPRVPEVLAPLINVIPLQLLAYHIAVMNGRDVDQPRNLAKSVTVE